MSHTQLPLRKPSPSPLIALFLLLLQGIVFLNPPECRAQWLPKPRPITIESANFENRGKEGLVCIVRMSKPVDLAQFRQHFSVTPAVKNLRFEPSYDNGFQASGNWKGRQAYKVTITPGWRDSEGLMVEKPIERIVSSQEVPPYLGFDQEGKFYFPRKGNVPLGLESRNVKKAQLTLYRLFPSNIAVALSAVENPQGSFAQWSEEITKQEIQPAFQLDELVKTPVNLNTLFPKKRRGVYCLESKRENDQRNAGHSRGSRWEDYDDYYGYGYGGGSLSRFQIIVQTNLGVLSHWQDKELLLFVHDLESLKPVWGAKATVYSDKNQVLDTGKTDFSGIAHFQDFKKSLGLPKVVVVERSDDYTFLELVARPDDAPKTAENAPAYNREDYDAFIYADRELYRPGETVHLRWMVRKNYGEVVAGVPLKMEIYKPNKKTIVSEPVTLSQLGTGGYDFSSQPIYPTGQYEVRLSVPGSEDKPIGTYNFQLEEFVPARMKASLTTKENRWVAGKDYEIVVNGQHLFGAPASQRKVSAKVSLIRSTVPFDKWKAYRFSNDTDTYLSPISLGDQTTNAEGKATFQFNWNPESNITFPLKGRVIASVFELGGRAVEAKTDIWMFPSDMCLGLHLEPAKAANEVVAQASAVRPDESAAPLSTVTLSLEKQTWHYYTRRYYGFNQQDWTNSFASIETRDVSVKDGKAFGKFTIDGSGSYRIRVSSPQTRQYSTVEFYFYGGRCQIVDTERRELVKLSLDKKSYEIGDTAELRIETPFDGKVFLVVQGDELHPMDPIDVRNNLAVAKLKIGKEHFPGIWLEATAIQSVGQEPMLISPFSAFASIRVPVENPERKLQVSFPALPEAIRPATENVFEVQVLDSRGKPAKFAEITLAAVDEGIHLMTNYKTPDPYAWLTRMRRPSLLRSHYYDKVAYETKKPDTGGDGGEEAEMGKRIAPAESWIKTVALWSGTLMTDSHGRVRVPLSVPEYSGQLRLVAVACTEEAMGSVGEQVFVRRPYMLQTSQPRFLLPGDAFQTHATFFNHSDVPSRIEITWQTSGTLEQASGQKSLTLASRSEGEFAIDTAARQDVGKGEIVWEAVVTSDAGKELERLSDRIIIPVKQPAVFQRTHEFLALKPGENRMIHPDGYIDNDVTELNITVGADALLRLQQALEYVVGYPYGCIEQTVSRLMPLYLLRHSHNLISSVLETPEALDGYIASGIDRLLSMQTQDGGMAFWPGGLTPERYASIYALHCLTLMKNDREVEIPQDNYDALQDFVRRIMRDWSQNDDAAVYQRAYATYVLALGGDIEAIQQISRFDSIPIPRAARYLLAAALAKNTQDPERIKKYIAEAPVRDYGPHVFDGNFGSPIRDEAVELMALEQANLDPARQAELVNRLTLFLQNKCYGNTQENSFIIAALDGYLRRMSASIDKATGTVTEPGGKQVQVAGRNLYQHNFQGRGAEYRIVNTGPVDLYVGVTRGGIPQQANPEAAASGGIHVWRALHNDPSGTRTLVVIQQAAGNEPAKPVFDTPAQQSGETSRTLSTMQQARSYVVELRISCDQEMKNIIIADLLPAGLEIENPRLNPDAIPNLPGAQSPTPPSHLEVRDDRLVLAYDQLNAGQHVFYYTVRAVTPGKFQRPSATAECMYDATIHSHTPMNWVEIRR